MGTRTAERKTRTVFLNGKEILIDMEPDPNFVLPKTGRFTAAPGKRTAVTAEKKEELKKILDFLVHSKAEPDLDAAADLIVSIMN